MYEQIEKKPPKITQNVNISHFAMPKAEEKFQSPINQNQFLGFTFSAIIFGGCIVLIILSLVGRIKDPVTVPSIFAFLSFIPVAAFLVSIRENYNKKK